MSSSEIPLELKLTIMFDGICSYTLDSKNLLKYYCKSGNKA